MIFSHPLIDAADKAVGVAPQTACDLVWEDCLGLMYHGCTEDCGLRNPIIKKQMRTFGPFFILEVSVHSRLIIPRQQFINPVDLVVCAALLHKSRSEDSPHESSVITGSYEQLAPYEIQEPELGRV